MFHNADIKGHVYCFHCSCHLQDGRSQVWDAKLDCISSDQRSCQARISFDGESHIFFIGEYINGCYISIPSLFTAADIGPLWDYSYNKNKLMKAGLSNREAASVSKALGIIDDQSGFRISYSREISYVPREEMDLLYSPVSE